MTIQAIETKGATYRNEHGDTAKLRYLQEQTLQRFMDLGWVREARAIDLRAAHRRWLRRNGRSLKQTRH